MSGQGCDEPARTRCDQTGGSQSLQPSVAALTSKAFPGGPPGPVFVLVKLLDLLDAQPFLFLVFNLGLWSVAQLMLLPH